MPERVRLAMARQAINHRGAEFGEIMALLDGPVSPEGWMMIHQKLSERGLDLDEHPDIGLQQTLQDQRRECNQAFGKYIQEHYADWDEFDQRMLRVTHTEHRIDDVLYQRIKSAFEAHLGPDGARFLRPSRVDLLRKPA